MFSTWFSIIWALTGALLMMSCCCVLFFCGALMAATGESAPPAVCLHQPVNSDSHGRMETSSKSGFLFSNLNKNFTDQFQKVLTSEGSLSWIGQLKLELFSGWSKSVWSPDVSNINIFLSVSQVFEAVPSGVLRLLSGDGGSLLPLHAVASVLPAARALCRTLRLLRRRLRGADPGGDVRPRGSSVPVLGAGRGLLPPRHPLPHQPANRRWETKTLIIYNLLTNHNLISAD